MGGVRFRASGGGLRPGSVVPVALCSARVEAPFLGNASVLIDVSFARAEAAIESLTLPIAALLIACPRRWTTGCPVPPRPVRRRPGRRRPRPGRDPGQLHREERLPPYDPRLVLRLLIYGCTTGVRSSRAIDRKCADDIAFRGLAADQARPSARSRGSAAAIWTPSRTCSPSRCSSRRGSAWSRWAASPWTARSWRRAGPSMTTATARGIGTLTILGVASL